MEGSLKGRRAYAKDNKLCYGCLKPGHCAKECHRRHMTCKLRHPTCLHDYGYDKDRSREQTLPMVSNAHVFESETTNAMSLNVTSEGQ